MGYKGSGQAMCSTSIHLSGVEMKPASMMEHKDGTVSVRIGSEFQDVILYLTREQLQRLASRLESLAMEVDEARASHDDRQEAGHVGEGHPFGCGCEECSYERAENSGLI